MTKATVDVFLALGSNLGDRLLTLNRALEMLRQCPGIQVVRVSTFLDTAPVGGPPGQGNYLNAVAHLQARMEAPELLRTLLDIEAKLGRVRGERFAARTLDLDLLLYGDQKILRHDPDLDLQVPHPRLHERLFVLEPLAELAPDLLHPVLGKSIHQLLNECRTRQQPGHELAGLRVLVTGSTSGIGQAIVQELAGAGASVLIHGRRSAARAEEVAERCRALGGQAAVLLGDLHDEVACVHLVEQGWTLWNGLDAWINNAGADTLTGDAARWPFEKKLEELWEVDVRATMLLSRRIGALMKERGSGVILNMGWDQADTGMEGDSGELFATTKGAVMAFTKSLALSLAPEVRVNCLAPGWIRTAWGEGASTLWQQRVLRETPLARWGTPQDVAQAARWLLSPGAAFVTGQMVRINGGAVRGS